MNVKEKAESLIRQGYRRVSNKYRAVARIDRKDWVEICYKHKCTGHKSPAIAQAVRTFYDGMPLDDFGFTRDTVEMESKMAADHYRRVFSEDRIEGLDLHVFTLIPSSGWDITGYCEKPNG
jgi:hypothetical protein